MNFSQVLLLEKFQGYIKCKKEHCSTTLEKQNCKLPFNTLQGLCSGLVALWLYHKRIDTEYEFSLMIQYIQNWQKSDFDGDDPVFEAALNDIAFLHFSYKLLDDLDQSSLNQSLQLLASKNHPETAPAEFSITWVFDHNSLHELLDFLLQNNKMLRVSDGLHVVGLIKKDNQIFYYDPDSSLGPQIMPNISQLVVNIFKSLPVERDTPYNIALHINRYDLVETVHPAPIDSSDFYKKLILDITNPNIFHLAVRYSDYKILDLLFESGYKYIPWQFNNTCELVEITERNDMQMLLYLIEHKIPLDYRAPGGITPLAAAVWCNNFDILYTLVQHGASIQERPHDFKSLIDIACSVNNFAAIIFLLSCGYNITTYDKKLILQKFGGKASEIYSNALTLQKVLLNIPYPFNLNISSYKSIIALLLHCQLQQKLFNKIDNIEINYDSKTYHNKEIFKAIYSFLNSQKKSNLYDFAETSQIYQLLDSMAHEPFNAKHQELLEVLNSICEAVIKKPLEQHNSAEILEISVILNILEGLTKMSGKNKSQREVAARARWVKNYIDQYLKKQNVITIEDYLQKKFPALASRPPSIFYLSSRDWEPMFLDLEELKKYTTIKLK